MYILEVKGMEKIAVLGAGNGGHACSADLSLKGYTVNLYELPRFKANIESIAKQGGIEIHDEKGVRFAKLNKVTIEIKEAIEDVDLILITVPAFAHKQFAEVCIPYLKDGQIVVYLGKGGGTLEFAKVMREMNVKKDILLGEANTLPYAARIIKPGSVRVFVKVKKLFIAALPAKNNQELFNFLKDLYPSVTLMSNVLETILNDVNAVLHPAPSILNAGRIEYSKGEFYIYKEGMTPSVINVIKAVDDERLAVVKALGFKQIPFEKLFPEIGFSAEGTLEEVVTHVYGAEGMKSPGSLQGRYITEDLPYGLVPIASIGDLTHTSTPVIKSLIVLASILNQVDYWKEGRTLEKLGVANLSLSELLNFITNGPIW
jgi:opine dehydrogenase